MAGPHVKTGIQLLADRAKTGKASPPKEPVKSKGQQAFEEHCRARTGPCAVCRQPRVPDDEKPWLPSWHQYGFMGTYVEICPDCVHLVCPTAEVVWRKRGAPSAPFTSYPIISDKVAIDAVG